MSWKSRIVVIVVGIMSFALGFIIGAYYGGFLTNWTLETISPLIAVFTIADVIGVIEMLRGIFKERKEAQRQPKLKYECVVEYTEAHHCSAISQRIANKGKIVSIRVENQGFDQAVSCSGRVDFMEETNKNTLKTLFQDLTLGWRHFEIDSDIEHNILSSAYQSLGDIIQKVYATKFNQNLKYKKAEWLEVCLTIEGHDVAHILSCGRKPKLQFGEKYQVTLQMVGEGLREKPKIFMLDIRSWDDISFKEVKEN